MWFFIAILIFQALLAAGFYFFQFKLIFKASPLPASFKFSFDIPFEEVFIQSGESKINGLIFKSSSANGLVIYFHGNANNLSHWGLIANCFTEKGYDLLIVDYPKFGKSTGKLSEKSLVQMGLDVYDFGTNYYSEKKIILYGRSIGTGIASKVATERNPSLLVLESPYVSLKRLVKHHAPRYSPASLLMRIKLNNDENIRKAKCPILIFHGKKDKIIPFGHSQELSSLLKKTDTFVGFYEGTHNNLSESADYHDELKKALDFSCLPILQL